MSKKKTKGKPIVQMDDLESARTWDSLMEDTNQAILKEAREGNSPICIAVAELTLSDGKVIPTHHTMEYGDGEGASQILHFIHQVRRGKMLREGESINRSIYQIDLQNARKIQ